MQIHSLSVPKRPGKKRVGRGGRRGKTAGRGTKGQKSRSGASVDPLFEGGRSSLIDRLKKVRGFKSPHVKRATVSLSFLEKHFELGETVNRDALIQKKLFSPKQLSGGIKVVATGTISKKLVFDSRIRFSETAQAAIEKAGGTIATE
ncbi:MAG: 50S ribosomal protein L15 [Candidatus Moranbacteria bacterium]|nr:50S ribosomal protein L15 [Candidatus Moranbacteria bacterium]